MLVKQDDLNFDWRAICDRRLSCPTLLSPIILFHFRKKLQKCLKNAHQQHTHPECITKRHRHKALAVSSCTDLFWERHHIFCESLLETVSFPFFLLLFFSSDRSLTSQVTLSKQKEVKETTNQKQLCRMFGDFHGVPSFLTTV